MISACSKFKYPQRVRSTQITYQVQLAQGYVHSIALATQIGDQGLSTVAFASPPA